MEYACASQRKSKKEVRKKRKYNPYKKGGPLRTRKKEAK